MEYRLQHLITSLILILTNRNEVRLAIWNQYKRFKRHQALSNTLKCHNLWIFIDSRAFLKRIHIFITAACHCRLVLIIKIILFSFIFYEFFFCNPIANTSIGCQWIVKCRLTLFHGCKFYSSAVSTYESVSCILLINSWNLRMMKFLSFSTRRCVFILSIASNDKIYFLMHQ